MIKHDSNNNYNINQGTQVKYFLSIHIWTKESTTGAATEALCFLTVMLSDLLPGQLLCRGKAIYQLLSGDRWWCGGQGGRRCGWVTEVILVEKRKRNDRAKVRERF